MVSAIILASGYSKRMSKNKLLLKYEGKPLVEHILDTILQCDFSEVILVGREEEIIEIGKRKGVKVLKNENAHKGISESIKVGVTNTTETDGYMFFTCDQPFLDTETVKTLIHKFTQNPKCIIVPQYKGRRGSPVIFPSYFKDDFLELQGDVGGKVIINKNVESVCFVEIQHSMRLFDIDTDEDYEYILKLKVISDYV